VARLQYKFVGDWPRIPSGECKTAFGDESLIEGETRDMGESLSSIDRLDARL